MIDTEFVLMDGTQVFIKTYGVLNTDVTIGIKWLENGKFYGRWMSGTTVARRLRDLPPEELFEGISPPETHSFVPQEGI